MATLINNSTGNLTAAATWSLVDSTSLSNSEAASTGTTTSWVASQTFTPGAITIDALAVKLLSHTAAGTFSVNLGKSGTITANTIANPTVVTSNNHGLTTGEAILIAGSNSTPALTGPYTVTVLTGNTFTVPVNVTVAGTAGTWSTVKAAIASNTNAASTVVTTTVAHGLTTGTQINIKGSTSTPSLNGTWTVTVITGTTFSIPKNTTSGFVSGGGVYNIVGVSDTTVSINTSDLDTVNTATNCGWVVMKLDSSVTLTANTVYSLQIQGTTAANATAYRTATAADWSRALRTTTTQAPVAADNIVVCGDFSTPGSNNNYTVTMDDTSAVTYGDLEISCHGKLAYGTSASTNYYFKLNNSPTVYTGGTLNIGTSGTPMPSTSTGKLEIVCSSNVQFGLEIRTGATVNTGGNVITNTAKLAADAAVAATSLTTDVSTGWKNGDVIALASTTRTRAECESKALTADASGTSLTITGLTNAHGGSAPIVAELANLTRNVSIFSTSTSNQTYITIVGGSVVDFESTEFYNMGSATALKRGIDVGTILGTCTINNCSIHDFNVASSLGINCNSATNNNLTISNNSLYNIANIGVNVVVTSNSNSTFNNLLCILSGASCFSFADLGGTITNITAVGGLTRGILLAEQGTAASGNFGTITNIIAHSNTGPGVDFTNLTSYGNNPYGLCTTINAWRNTTFGIVLSNTFDLIVDTITAFGNATANLQYGGSCGNTYVKSLTSNAGTTLTCPVGVQVGNDIKETYCDNSTFGATTTHATGDVQVSAANIYPRVFFRNCSFNSATQVATPINMIEGGQINSARHMQTSGNHKVWKKFGTITSDTTIWNRASPSARLTPNSATNKIIGDIHKVAVPSGQTITIKVFVRKSVVGDGTAYNGNQPRLIQKADGATGNNSDTVIATATNAANGAFQLLTATTAAVTDDCVVTFYIDADGTTGWVNVDDWSANS